jgi:hypothetical protein
MNCHLVNFKVFKYYQRYWGRDQTDVMAEVIEFIYSKFRAFLNHDIHAGDHFFIIIVYRESLVDRSKTDMSGLVSQHNCNNNGQGSTE